MDRLDRAPLGRHLAQVLHRLHARDATAARMEKVVAERDRVRAPRVPEIDSWQAGNATQARCIRAHFDAQH